MTVRATPMFIQGNSHNSEEMRLMYLSMMGGAPSASPFAGGVSARDTAHGIARDTDLAVTANSTPNMTVWVAASGCFVRSTSSGVGGVYHVVNDAAVQLTVTAADATNPRRDLVIARRVPLDAKVVDVAGLAPFLQEDNLGLATNLHL